MQRCCWTLVVLIGSSNWPPSRAVQSSSIASSTTKRRAIREPHTTARLCRSGPPGRWWTPAAQRTIHPAASTPPHLAHHAAEMRVVVGEMQNGAADHRVHAVIAHGRASSSPTWKLSAEAPARASAASDRTRLTARRPGRCRSTRSRAGESRSGCVRRPARIEHPEPAVETASQDLIEEVDVDLAEGGPQLVAGFRNHHGQSHGIDCSDVRHALKGVPYTTRRWCRGRLKRPGRSRFRPLPPGDSRRGRPDPLSAVANVRPS